MALTNPPEDPSTGETISVSEFGHPVYQSLNELDARSVADEATIDTKADKSTTISAGTGLTGGGSLAANRTLAVSYGTSSGTAAQGNDSRIVNAVPNTRQITAGTGLTGGGALSADRSLAVNFGSTSSTVASGDRVSALETVNSQGGHWVGSGTGQTLTYNSILKIQLPTTDYQTGLSIASGTDITVPAGRWLFYGGTRFVENRTDWIRTVLWFGLSSDQSQRLGFALNGPGINGVQNAGLSFSIPVTLATPTTVSLWFYQQNTAGADVTAFYTYNSTEVSIARLG